MIYISVTITIFLLYYRNHLCHICATSKWLNKRLLATRTSVRVDSVIELLLFNFSRHFATLFTSRAADRSKLNRDDSGFILCECMHHLRMFIIKDISIISYLLNICFNDSCGKIGDMFEVRRVRFFR